jgi:hypothetical protein
MQVELFTSQNILIGVWTLEKYLIQQLAHQCHVRDNLAENLTFGSNLVVPIIKTDFKCSCDNEISTIFGFNVFFRTLALPRNGEALSGRCSKNLRISMSHVI